MASRLIKATEEPGSRMVTRPPAPAVDDSPEAQQVADAAEAVRIRMERAEEEAQALLVQATEEGLEEGRRSAADVTELAEKLHGQLTTGLEQEALEAAVDAARELLAAEFKARPRAIVDLVKKALGSAKHQKEIFLRASPRDAGILREAKRELLDVLSRARDLDIRDDPGMAAGGCVIETELGVVDAAVDAQMDRLARILLGRAPGPAR